MTKQPQAGSSSSGGGSGSGLGSSAAAAARPPAQFCCPLTLELMVDPVSLASGQTYERQAISQWMTEARRTGQQPRDPMTNTPLESRAIVPNIALRQLIELWKAANHYDANECVTEAAAPVACAAA